MVSGNSRFITLWREGGREGVVSGFSSFLGSQVFGVCLNGTVIYELDG